MVSQPGREPQGGSPTCPHPHHNRHPGKQDGDGAKSPSGTNTPLGISSSGSPYAHRDQDVGTRDGQVLTSTTPRPPCPASAATSQILLVVWALAKHPHPCSRDHNFPVASGY